MPPWMKSDRHRTYLYLIDMRMEVSRRRTIQKHLEPARPLRRLLPVDIRGSTEPQINPTSCVQTLINIADKQTNITVEQFLEIVNLQDEKKREIVILSRFSDRSCELSCCQDEAAVFTRPPHSLTQCTKSRLHPGLIASHCLQ
nr:uncharacterized protein C8orf88 homolog isoform X1 [Syngnathus scovelli]